MAVGHQQVLEAVEGPAYDLPSLVRTIRAPEIEVEQALVECLRSAWVVTGHAGYQNPRTLRPYLLLTAEGEQALDAMRGGSEPAAHAMRARGVGTTGGIGSSP